MDIETFRNYCLSKKGVTESVPFSDLPSVLVFKVMGKIFTVTDMDTFDSITIKCHPETIEDLRSKHDAVVEPRYFNKKHWSMVNMDYTISDTLLQEWIDISYDLVVEKLTRKQKNELLGES